jgi:preprotein translocase SecE subunit
MSKILNYLTGVRHELSLVVWPKKEEVIRLTLVVFIISAIVALYVGGLDLLLIKLLEILISK